MTLPDLPVVEAPKTFRVFVYGTLKKREQRHHALETAKYLGETWVWGYSLVNLGSFPAMYKNHANPDAQVKGEVYEVDIRTLNRLDAIEGIPTFYQRTEVSCGSLGDCWAYTQPMKTDVPFKRVVSGIWEGPNSPCITVTIHNGTPKAPEATGSPPERPLVPHGTLPPPPPKAATTDAVVRMYEAPEVVSTVEDITERRAV